MAAGTDPPPPVTISLHFCRVRLYLLWSGKCRHTFQRAGYIIPINQMKTNLCRLKDFGGVLPNSLIVAE